MSQNILFEISNSALYGIPQAIKNSTQEAYNFSKLTNEAIYYFQVKTFLETIDLSEEDVSIFMNNNPEHQRLGLEIFKILESTFLDKQSIMIAKAFKLYLQKLCTRIEFDKYIYIITKLNAHLIYLIESFYETDKDITPSPHTLENGGLGQAIGRTSSFQNPNMDLISFGFLQEEQQIAYAGAELLPTTRYIRTESFYDFYQLFFKDN